MLDEKLTTRTLFEHLRLQLAGGAELVKAGADDFGDLLFFIPAGGQIPPGDFQPAIGLPDFLPQVACAVAVTGWIALCAVVALVKWQKARAWSGKLGRHLDLAVAHSKMDQS